MATKKDTAPKKDLTKKDPTEKDLANKDAAKKDEASSKDMTPKDKSKAKTPMTFKKFLRGPWLWIALALSVLLIGTSLIGAQQFTKVDTQVGLEMIKSGDAEKVTIFDGNQRVDVELRNPDAEFGQSVQFYFVSGRAVTVAEIVADSQISEGWTDEVPSTPWYLAILGSLLSFIIIGALFWFLMSSMSGGGRGVMQFGKSKAKMVTKETSDVTFDDVAGIEEAI